MKKFIALFIFCVSLFVTATAAQCPEISLTGPVGIVPPGEATRFTLTVSGETSPGLKFIWRVTGGTILSGQSTTSIELKPEGSGLRTASVEIEGLPENCPNTFSDSSFGDPTPIPFKVGVWKRGDAFERLRQFQADMANAPDHQGYIFVIRSSRSTENSLSEIKRAIRRFAPGEQSGEFTRITFVEADGPHELLEIWRVPPGASSPECESCREPYCPELITFGPTSPPAPGKPIKFSLSLKGETPTDLRFEWTTNTGQILTGQGTTSIRVMPPWEKDWNLHATVVVSGLPSSCPSTAVESIMRPDLPHPVLIDEFVVASASMPPDRLKIAVGELKNNPSDQLFLILYHPKSESQFKVREVIKKLKDFFDGESELDSDRYSIVSSASEGYRLQIYRIPPGADKPTP